MCRLAAADPFTSLAGFFRDKLRDRVTLPALARRFADGRARVGRFLRVGGETVGRFLTGPALPPRLRSKLWVAIVCCAHPENPPGGIKIAVLRIFSPQ